jgi:hypothetical protein
MGWTSGVQTSTRVLGFVPSTIPDVSLPPLQVITGVNLPERMTSHPYLCFYQIISRHSAPWDRKVRRGGSEGRVPPILRRCMDSVLYLWYLSCHVRLLKQGG